jgi:nucleotide-binding universal stress UspA family protein
VTYENVVVGSDGSATAELAVRNAAEIAAEHGARLVIVTAYKAPCLKMSGGRSLTSTKQRNAFVRAGTWRQRQG